MSHVGKLPMPVTRHPAKFSPAVLDAMIDLWPMLTAVMGPPLDDVTDRYNLLDPFAGSGRVHVLGQYLPVDTVGVEIEAEWAAEHPATRHGDATELPAEWTGSFDLLFSSMVYGNRLSDHHDARDDSERHTYTHYLGHDLQPNNAGRMHFPSKPYIDLHEKAWREGIRVVRPGGLIVLNVSNFLVDKGATERRVVEFHTNALLMGGCFLEAVCPIETPRLAHGQNYDQRVPFERLVVARTPTDPQRSLL